MYAYYVAGFPSGYSDQRGGGGGGLQSIIGADRCKEVQISGIVTVVVYT